MVQIEGRQKLESNDTRREVPQFMSSVCLCTLRTQPARVVHKSKPDCSTHCTISKDKLEFTTTANSDFQASMQRPGQLRGPLEGL